MALINCPECKREVSDKAMSCPGCGHPLQQERSLSIYNVLIGKRWKARSHTLGPGRSFDIMFSDNGEFIGLLTGDGNLTPLTEQINGKWQVIELQLFLDYVYTMLSGCQGFPLSTHIKIQFTQGSKSKLLGVDQWARAWDWEIIG